MDDMQIRLAFVTLTGVPPRLTDLMMLHTLGTQPEHVADYLWDHILGEPETPTTAQVLDIVRTCGTEVPNG